MDWIKIEKFRLCCMLEQIKDLVLSKELSPIKAKSIVSNLADMFAKDEINEIDYIVFAFMKEIDSLIEII